jgi:hypothetical protein
MTGAQSKGVSRDCHLFVTTEAEGSSLWTANSTIDVSSPLDTCIY